MEPTKPLGFCTGQARRGNSSKGSVILGCLPVRSLQLTCRLRLHLIRRRHLTFRAFLFRELPELVVTWHLLNPVGQCFSNIWRHVRLPATISNCTDRGHRFFHFRSCTLWFLGRCRHLLSKVSQYFFGFSHRQTGHLCKFFWRGCLPMFTLPFFNYFSKQAAQLSRSRHGTEKANLLVLQMLRAKNRSTPWIHKLAELIFLFPGCSRRFPGCSRGFPGLFPGCFFFKVSMPCMFPQRYANHKKNIFGNQCHFFLGTSRLVG